MLPFLYRRILYRQFMESEDMELNITETPEDPSKFTFYLRDNLQIPFIKDKLKEKRIQQSIIDFIGKFLDDNASSLSTPGPTYMIPFLDPQTKFFFDLFGVDKPKIVTMIKEFGKIAFPDEKEALINIKGFPHKLLFIAMLIEAIQNNYQDIVEACKYLFIFPDYGVLFRRYWRLGVKEEVMNYTIENLPSNKYKAKKMNNILALMKYDTSKCIETHLPRLTKGYDQEYKYFADRVRTQINNTLKGISRKYFDNVNDNKAMIIQKDKFDDGKRAEIEGQQQIMGQAVDKALNGFMSTALNATVIKMISQAGELDASQLTNFLNQILNDKRNRLEVLIESILGAYFQYNPSANTISGGEFVNFGIGLYKSIATSKKELYMTIKKILNIWIDEIIDIKKYFKGSTTISNYSRGIFNYIIIMINHYN